MISFRDAAEADRPQLISLWSRSFGDPDDMIEDFLKHFGIATGVVGVQDGIIVCGAYILPTDGIHSPDGGWYSCSYIYAVAVLPEFRGSGLGREITREAVRFSKERGFEFTVLKPSNIGLFDFYRKLGFSDFSYINELTFSKLELPENDTKNKITEVSSVEYLLLRENCLSETPHIIPSPTEVSYQAKLGKLFGLKLEQGCGCAAVETYGDTAYIKELIIPQNDIQSAVSLISEAVPASIYMVRIPVSDLVTATPNGMIFPAFETGQKKPYLGLAFD